MSPGAQNGEDARTHAESVAAVFRTVTFGTIAAWIGSLLLVGTLSHLGIADTARGVLFAGYIGACALAHNALAYFYRRSPDRIERARPWGAAFAAIALLEGCGWGWLPLGLVPDADFTVQLLCLLTTFGVAGGAIPAFSPYLPAFAALFVPATLPYAVHLAANTEGIQQSAALLVDVYIVAMGAFGVFSNRAFRSLVHLRLHAEILADDLRRQVKIAETANRAKSSFLAAASHDLRQPVHALGLFVGALRGMPMSPQAMAILAQIEASSQAMDGLFAALLDISRLDAGTVEVNRDTFPVAPLLERICQEHAREAEAKDIALKMVASSAYLETDPILVERILRNLVSNAVRYTASGVVLVGCRNRGPTVSIEVLDSGPGIAPDQQEQIFEEYYQIGNPERDRTKGLGLGLAIVRRLTTLLGCDLTLQSIAGSGSRFAVTVPRARHANIPPTHERGGAPQPLGGRTIVVVDDEADIRAAMATVLHRWGHRVVVASDGTEAIVALADCPVRPDLIISDFRLRQKESGIDVIESLRLEYNARIPAILITGDTAPERLVEARESGLLLLHKPVSNARLRAAIANVMAGATA